MLRVCFSLMIEKNKSSIIVLLIFLCTIFDSSFIQAKVSFLAMGDSPYGDEDFYLIEQELQNIPNNVKFLIHLGDIKPKEKECEENNNRYKFQN